MIEDLQPQSDTLMSRLRAENISQRILTIRGHRVLLDADLAALYDVPTKAFNQAIQRNMDRFPEDFMFQLTEEEFAGLRSQFVTSKKGRGGRRYHPYVFTERRVRRDSSLDETTEDAAKADRILIYSRFDLVRNPEGAGGGYPSTREIEIH